MIHLATINAIGELNGKYFYGMQMRDASPKCNNRALQAELWRVSVELTGLG